MLEEVRAGLQATIGRTRAGFARLETDHADVASALKSAASKRIVESDPALKQQLQATLAQVKTDEKRAADTQLQLAELQKLAQAEFAQMSKILGS